MFSKKLYALWSDLSVLLASAKMVYTVIALISALALAGALISQHVFGLAPCILCLYQRIPYALAIGAGLAGLLSASQKPPVRAVPAILCSVLFLINFVIASHHVGVEQKWWPSYAESCKIEMVQTSVNREALLEKIMSAPAVPCDEIPWADPIFGFSMAVYNTLLSLAMAILSGLAGYMIARVSPKRKANRD